MPFHGSMILDADKQLLSLQLKRECADQMRHMTQCGHCDATEGCGFANIYAIRAPHIGYCPASYTVRKFE